MEQGLIDSLWLMGGYTLWIFVLYFLMNALTLRFLSTYLAVRTSMGRKTLVEVKGVTSYYFKVGYIEDGFLRYKNSKKEDKKISVTHKGIGRKMGVNFVVVDEETNNVLNPGFDAITGWDAIKYNNLYVRALQAPNLAKDKNKILILLLIACLLGILVVGFMLFQQGTVLAELKAVTPANTI